MGNKQETSTSEERKPIVELNDKTLSLKEYAELLRERGFDTSKFNPVKLTKDEKQIYWREAYDASLTDMDEHPIKWIFSKDYRDECINKHLRCIIESHLKDQLKKYCGIQTDNSKDKTV